MPAEARRDWTRAHRRLHWWTACLVVIAFPLGWIMVGISLDQLFLKFALYQLHKTIGILVFVLVLARLTVRSRRGRPAWDDALFPWQRRAAETMHASLYVLLVAIPLLGYLTAATAPARIPTLFLGVLPIPHIVGADAFWFDILRQTHRALAVLLVALAFGHAVAAIVNHLNGHPGLTAMWSGREPRMSSGSAARSPRSAGQRTPTTPPAARSRARPRDPRAAPRSRS